MNDIDKQLDLLHHQIAALRRYLKTNAHTKEEQQQVYLELTWCHQSVLAILQQELEEYSDLQHFRMLRC